MDESDRLSSGRRVIVRPVSDYGERFDRSIPLRHIKPVVRTPPHTGRIGNREPVQTADAESLRECAGGQYRGREQTKSRRAKQTWWLHERIAKERDYFCIKIMKNCKNKLVRLTNFVAPAGPVRKPWECAPGCK